jgi:PAS domain-containing protein
VNARPKDPPMHKLLAQQIAKSKTETGSIDLDRLIGLVSRAYQELDRDPRRTERSMFLMVEEIGTVQRDLERLVAERTAELRAREADLHAQNMRFNAAVSNMSQGLVMFDGDSRLVMYNSRYAEMYRLRSDDIHPGLTLRALLERRAAAGTFS